MFEVAPHPAIDPESDPFLEGHEDRTPREVFALRPNGSAPDGPGWRVRVVPNLYPSLRPDGDSAAPADPLPAGRRGPDLFPSPPAPRAHQGIVDAPPAR